MPHFPFDFAFIVGHVKIVKMLNRSAGPLNATERRIPDVPICRQLSFGGSGAV